MQWSTYQHSLNDRRTGQMYYLYYIYMNRVEVKPFNAEDAKTTTTEPVLGSTDSLASLNRTEEHGDKKNKVSY